MLADRSLLRLPQTCRVRPILEAVAVQPLPNVLLAPMCALTGIGWRVCVATKRDAFALAQSLSTLQLA